METFSLYITALFPSLDGLPPVEQGFVFMIALFFVSLAPLVVIVAFRGVAGSNGGR